ncbi:MFS transporter [Alloyangia pacifica]|uniref:Sugar phosphate permease n=1 Tax=Alloyangia pacifica TaxID=311180 RepID=A0A1I6VY57_9RHOB|nr:MFS transporter [Alloyangia pacifica]SDI19080.1 Sugar phosphate permease [Alloyangia pacifica]SFT18623.1 Sugar phosphate permease [Alloyangia pacifica]
MEQVKQTPAQPDRYRWIIVGAASVVLAVAMGQLVNGLSAFFTPLEESEGWSRGDIALINSAGLIGLAVGGIAMGWLADRIETRKVVLAGTVVTGICITAAGFATTLWQLYTLFFVAGALGGGALFAPLFALVGSWFRTGAGLAIGIVSAGQAMGQGGIPLANAMLIDALGWRGAFVAIGIASLVIMVPLALLARAPNSGTGGLGAQAEEEAPAVRPSVVVVLMSLGVVFCCALMSVPLMHLAPLVELCGATGPEAGGVVFVMMLSAIAGRIAFGKLADMIGALPAYLAASAWQATLVYVFIQIDDIGLFYLFAPIYGFGYAGVMTGVLTSIRALIPAYCRAGASGIIIAFAWGGHGLGGWLGGAFFDMTGSYGLTFGVAALAGVANLALILTLGALVLRGRSGPPAPLKPAMA